MEKRDYIQSTGNVFADLEIPGAEESLAKAELARRIAAILQERHLTQMQAAAILNVDQPKVSLLIRGRLSGFSIERLLRFLLLLGSDVAITIKPRHNVRSKARTRTVQGKSGLSERGKLTVDDFVSVKAS
ncbi:MAG: helix-turn-helix domain-containing protein [Acidobacteriaceae bacterium]